MQYFAQTKTITGVIFHYRNLNHTVESLFYTNDELDSFSDKDIMPEYYSSPIKN